MEINILHRPNFNIRIWGFTLNIGWYPGDEFHVFLLEFLGVSDHKFVTLFSIQITKLLFGIYWSCD